MSAPSSEQDEPVAIPVSVHVEQEKITAKRWQINVRSIILLIAVIAVWMTAHVNKEAIDSLEKRNQTMRPLAHLLKVDDPEQFAVVLLEPLWQNDLRWEIYVPSGRFRLFMATREVRKQGVAKPITSVPIKSGRHRIALVDEKIDTGTRIQVLCDGAKLLKFEESSEWGGMNWRSYADFSTSEQRATDQPLPIYRRRISKDFEQHLSEKVEPSDGILIWIERDHP
jgi:hypothetical protein